MKLPIKLSQDSREPIYHQIVEQLKTIIAGGHLSAGTPLPSIRVLAKDLEISVITTRKAYQNLESDGFIRTMQGKGTFVEDVSQYVKKEVKIASVYDSFEKAVDIAFAYEYSPEQIEDIFHETINNYQKKKGESS